MARRNWILMQGFLAVLAACAPPGTDVVGTSSGTEATSATSAAASAFLAALPDSTRSVAILPFEGTERMRWFFVPDEQVPQGRFGLPLKRMRPAERDAAWRLAGTALSSTGLQTARAISENESALRAIEDAAGTRRFARDPDLYYFSVFGTPSATAPWGWRVDGHHLTLNVTGIGSQAQTIAPVFMGANPHRFVSGPQTGFRLLAREEDVARELLALFAPEQLTRVIVSATTQGEIHTRNDPRARELPLEGLAAAEMNPQQRAKLRELLEVYAHRLTPAAAREQLDRIDRAGFDSLRFAWRGSVQPGVGNRHYYRIHGPTVLVEYDNSQNNANHSHTVWRDLENDFGGDLLRKHYEQHAHVH